MGLYILLAVLAVLVIFICVLLIRAALAAKKAEPIGEKPVYTTEQEDIENGERLMKMIECQTVSSREIYDDTEFAKLRAAVTPAVLSAAEPPQLLSSPAAAVERAAAPPALRNWRREKA